MGRANVTLAADQQTNAPPIPDFHGPPIESPCGTAWAFSRLMPDTGGIETMVASGGRERRLTFTSGDDKPLDWSPDCRSLVIMTGRWHPEGIYELAVLDLAEGSVVRLTETDAHELRAAWSPDGTRIAFLRNDDAGPDSRLCLVSVDGEAEECVAELPRANRQLVAWYDPDVVVTTADSGLEGRIVRLNVETRELASRPALTGNTMLASPDGRWVVCDCNLDAEGGNRWVVHPTDRPDLSKPVVERDPGDVRAWTWSRKPHRSGFLDALAITHPPGIPLNTPTQLVAVGSDSSYTRRSESR